MLLNNFIFMQTAVEEKLAKAPEAYETGYKLGLLIGSLLPFVVLVGIVYFLYYRFKNRKD